MKGKWKQVDVAYGDIDGESLPITCVCGYGKEYWSFPISIYRDDPDECPKCGRRYYFSNSIEIFMKEPEQEE